MCDAAQPLPTGGHQHPQQPRPPLTFTSPTRPILTSSNYLQVQTHYARLLTEHYIWLFGGFATKLAQNRTLLQRYLPKITPPPGDDEERPLAVDLGCGPGFQTIPLLHLHYTVLALDASPQMLAELTSELPHQNLPSHHLTTAHDDLLLFPSYVPDATAAVIVCMGDTLSHLATLNEVRKVVADAHAALKPGGRLVLQFRDLTRPLRGTDRFVPVQSDSSTIFTCFLEWEGECDVDTGDAGYVEGDCTGKRTPQQEFNGLAAGNQKTNGNTTSINASPHHHQAHVESSAAREIAPCGSGRRVKVHDLVYVRKGNGTWDMCKSWYHKLALSSEWVGNYMREVGFDVLAEDEGESLGGMEVVVGVKVGS
ncbi:S-adenosyl-L-methionine-dependent methyltransferase [Fimicolochytrium jonesii]|uniref:S-adenosyl-L-methionine-dependent methyltransferase n=1 Tax=Fimicolochytrium jonesii TaxID=1396493 RepID=UPI0022FEC056|nr:S-adenosyl-L-methionine-dependent methyltransferase [Fimicolochytrium jonesii]KAI8826842.1 S-adenosyl-L-methionine-dependent methyltransferase [Fimicolochytrium jonesii]